MLTEESLYVRRVRRDVCFAKLPRVFRRYLKAIGSVHQMNLTKRISPSTLLRRRDLSGATMKAFMTEMKDGDEVWRYTDVRNDGTFASGTKGLALVRGGVVVTTIVLSTVD